MEQLFSDGNPQGLLQKDTLPSATFPNGFEVSFSLKNFPCFLLYLIKSSWDKFVELALIDDSYIETTHNIILSSPILSHFSA